MATKPNFTTLTPADLDRLSEVTEQDILETHNRIVKAVQKRYVNLITTVEDVPVEVDILDDANNP